MAGGRYSLRALQSLPELPDGKLPRRYAGAQPLFVITNSQMQRPDLAQQLFDPLVLRPVSGLQFALKCL